MKNENMKKNNKGFSLVELIVVIAIMAVLMVILAPAMLRYVEKTRVQKDESAISEVANAAELALGEESIYSSIDGTGDITVTVHDRTAINATATYVSGTSGNPVAEDIQKTVGQSVSFASKKYKNAGDIKIVLKFSDTKQAYVVATTTAGKPFDTDATKLVSY